MKFCLVMLISLLLGSAWTQAQVEVEVVLDQEQFLRDESLPIKVRIVNRSGQTLLLGTNPGWLTFHLENRDGRIISPRSELSAQGEFRLESSRMATRTVDLMPCYDLSPGRYFVTAVVKIPQWQQEALSPRKIFEIIRGITFWEETVGVPTEKGVPEGRKFMLQQANYLSHPFLYVRLTDVMGNRVFSVLPMGRLLSFSRPEAQIDRLSNLHVLFQTGPRAFTYCVVSPLGRMTVRQRHDYSQTRPALKSDGEGNITVSGGIRRVTRSDIPPPQDSKPTDEGVSPTP